MTTLATGPVLPLDLGTAEWSPPRQGEWTYEDYCQLPDDAGERYEIIEGVLYVMSGPTPRHQRSVGRVHYRLIAWTDRTGFGEAFVSPLDLRLPGHRSVMQPDVLWVPDDRLKIIGPQYLEGVPGLVVEVISPGRRRYDRVTKFTAYEDAGVPEYWLIDLDDRRIEVYELRNRKYQLAGSYAPGESARSVMLEGFEVAVDEVCPKESAEQEPRQ